MSTKPTQIQGFPLISINGEASRSELAELENYNDKLDSKQQFIFGSSSLFKSALIRKYLLIVPEINSYLQYLQNIQMFADRRSLKNNISEKETSGSHGQAQITRHEMKVTR